MVVSTCATPPLSVSGHAPQAKTSRHKSRRPAIIRTSRAQYTPCEPSTALSSSRVRRPQISHAASPRPASLVSPPLPITPSDGRLNDGSVCAHAHRRRSPAHADAPKVLGRAPSARGGQATWRRAGLPPAEAIHHRVRPGVPASDEATSAAAPLATPRHGRPRVSTPPPDPPPSVAACVARGSRAHGSPGGTLPPGI